MKFLKSIYTAVVLASCLATQVSATVQQFEEEKQDPATGIYFKLDQFGNPNITQKIFENKEALDPLGDRLEKFYLMHREKYIGKAFIARIPRENSDVTPHLKKAGFKLYYADTDREEWVISNGSTMPAAYTAIGGAFALVFNDRGEVLIEADCTKKQNVDNTRVHKLWLPGGSIDRQELPAQAAVREVREETGVDIDVIQPAYTRVRTSGNRYGANDIMWVFIGKYISGTVLPQASEVDHAAFVDPALILKSPKGSVSELAGHKYFMGGFAYDVLRHVQEKRPASYKTGPDFLSPDRMMEETYFPCQ